MYFYSFVGLGRFCEDVALMIGRTPPKYFRVCWPVITPVTVIVSHATKIDLLSVDVTESWNILMFFVGYNSIQDRPV